MEALVAALTIFVLALFVGFEVITKVPPTLHTPLMSGSNAISGITLVGAILSSGAQYSTLSTVLGTWRSSSRRSTWWAGSWSPTGSWACSDGRPEP